LKPFKPSLDWGHELIPSLLWVSKGFAICAICLLLLGVVVVRKTTWGRQFWRITGDYFKGSESVPVWGLFAVLLLLVIIAVRIDVLLSYYSNDLFSALQAAFLGSGSGDAAVRNSGIHGFWIAIGTFGVIATVHVARSMIDLYLMQRFIIRWRVWLTHRLTGDWLDGRAYYRARFIDTTTDNPDQRIQQDIDIFTTGVGSPNTPSYSTGNILLFGAVNSVVSVVSFTAILWNLSGDLHILGLHVPKALFWIVVGYVLIATVIAFWIGRPLIGLSFVNELTNAAFRYALVRLRDAAEAIGFYRGARAERTQLDTRFSSTITNYRHYVRRSVGFLGWNLSVSQAINPLPWLVQAPRLFHGQITLGGVSQSAMAFNHIHNGLSFFRNAYDHFASYRASIMRLHGLVEANAAARRLPVLATASSVDGSVELDDVQVWSPVRGHLIDPLNLRLEPGDSIVITGPSGTGKTTLLRSLAELWPFTSGTFRRPGGADTMFVPQLPYVPLGDLRAVVSYPGEPGEIGDDRLGDVLSKVALGHLRARLDEEADWAKVLSPGEQQRVAFARVLLTKPKAVFLDEATSAVDEGLEFALYQLLRTELPDCIVVSISHRSTVEQHHDQLLELIGEGQWRLGRVAKEPEYDPAYVQERRSFKSPRLFESPHSSNGLAVARAHDPSRVP
jgi:vitamin B12/bleomycin/antimicrobial peptide transport system ATP-binding/permease protein